MSKISIEYRVGYVLSGFNDEVVESEHVMVDTVSEYDDGDMIMSGAELDYLLAEDIIRTYLLAKIGADVVGDRAILSALTSYGEAMYAVGKLTVAVGDPVARVMGQNDEVSA